MARPDEFVSCAIDGRARVPPKVGHVWRRALSCGGVCRFSCSGEFPKTFSRRFPRAKRAGHVRETLRDPPAEMFPPALLSETVGHQTFFRRYPLRFCSCCCRCFFLVHFFPLPLELFIYVIISRLRRDGFSSRQQWRFCL